MGGVLFLIDHSLTDVLICEVRNIWFLIYVTWITGWGMQAGEEVWCECKEHGSTVSKMLGGKKKKRSKSKASSTFPLLSAVILLFYSAWSRWRSRSTRLPICLFQIRQHPSPLKTFHQHPDSRELSICHRLQTVWSGTQHQLDKTRLFKCKVNYNSIVNENPLWKCFSILNNNFFFFYQCRNATCPATGCCRCPNENVHFISDYESFIKLSIMALQSVVHTKRDVKPIYHH